MTRTRRRSLVVGLTLWLCLAATLSADAREQGGTGPNASTSDAASKDGAVNKINADESFLSWMARASGPIGIVILGMSFYLIALVSWMFLHYRRDIVIPRDLTREVGELLERKKFTEAYQRLAQDQAFLSRVLAAGVRKLPSGLPAAQRAMEMVNDDVTMEMEHRTTYLATVGTLGPMIGLVGTVYGMILSFRVIATAGSNPQASQLAGGISTALFATLEGIAISVPAIAFYALFRNRIARLSLEVEMMAESLLEGFTPGVRMPHPLVTQATAATGAQRTALPSKGEG
jgi:biopolymer transport protein ExbB